MALTAIRRMIDRTLVTLRVNGSEHRLAVRPYEILLDVLRDGLNLTGTRRGCDMGTCGCCTVLIDGKPTLSCLTLAHEAEGKAITTVEAVAGGAGLHPVQEAWVETGASQCGFCSPGFIMTALAFVEAHENPTEEAIREAISGNMCRCTGYLSIIEAVAKGAAEVARRRAAGTYASPVHQSAAGTSAGPDPSSPAREER
jgi:aerobic carbon-monoxide dehydrogenase small subunit